MEPDTFPLTSNLSVHNEGGNAEQYGIKLAVSIYEMFNVMQSGFLDQWDLQWAGQHNPSTGKLSD